MKGRHLLLSGLLFAAGIALIVIAYTNTGVKPVLPEKAEEMIRTDTSVVVLDVRTTEEYKSETGHLARAILIPVQELEGRIEELAPFRDRTIITYCRSGKRSSKAADILSARGFRVLNMEGGILKWDTLNLPVVKEENR